MFRINSKCVNKKFNNFNKQIILFIKWAFSEILTLLFSGYYKKCKSATSSNNDYILIFKQNKYQ